MSLFFIRRPNFAWVVALFISMAGLLAMPFLPVAQYPNVAPPQITISATYPGASAQVLTDSVTGVIEEELNGAKNLLYFESSSNANGMSEITATFQPGTSPELAQVEVQNRLKKAEARMPQAVLTQGIQTEQASAGFLLIYTLRYKDGAKHENTTALADFVVRNINPEIRRLPGVGKLQFFDSEAAMRVWIDPQKLVGFGLSVDDVNSAIRGQNVQVPAGAFGSTPGASEQELTATLAVKGTLDTPEEFGRIVLRANQDGSSVLLSDVARLEVGSENYNFGSRQDGKLAVAAAVQLSPGANAISTAAAIKKRLDELSASLPDNVEVSIPYDTSRFVDVAISKVITTLVEAMVLVFLVMFLFPPERALYPDPRHRGAGVLGWYADLHVPARLLSEHDDHVRHGPGHRHSGGRCHCGGGERRTHHGRGRSVAGGRDHQGDGTSLWGHHRHHPGAVGGVPAAGFHGGLGGCDLPAVSHCRWPCRSCSPVFWR
jgi:multidrug efflux pump